MGADRDTFLSCGCGMKLKTTGARPGRVGKCPRCGALFRIPGGPEPATASGLDQGQDPDDAGAAGSAFEKARGTRDQPSRPSPKRRKAAPPVGRGRLVERRFVDSLGYPVRDGTGMSFLVFEPVLLTLCSAPMFVTVSLIFSTNPMAQLMGLITTFPCVVLFLFVAGHSLVFFGEVATSSSVGDPNLPRPASWSLSEIFRAWTFWGPALVVGVGGGLFPASAYWVFCGEVDWLDRVVIVDLLLPGLGYAELAIMATLLNETPMAANPITVFGLLGRAGRSFFPLWLATSGLAFASGGLLFASLQTSDFAVKAILYYLFWAFSAYAVVLALRRLGLFCCQKGMFARSPRSTDEKQDPMLGIRIPTES